MKKQGLAFLCTSTLLMGVLAGCGGSDSQASTATEISPSPSTPVSQETNTNTLVGQIQSVDGDTITLLLGELSQAQPGQDGGPGAQGQAGGVSSGENAPQAAQGSAVPDNTSSPDASSNGQQAPSGNPPQGDSGNHQQHGGKISFTAGSETTAVAVNDQTVFNLTPDQDGTGSLEDLTKGSVVTVTLNADDTAAAITVEQTEDRVMEPDVGGPTPGVETNPATTQARTSDNVSASPTV